MITREQLLREFTNELGKPIAAMENPSYWAAEDHHRAKPYVVMARCLRTAYRRLCSPTADVCGILKELRVVIVTGVERNVLEKLIEKVQP